MSERVSSREPAALGRRSGLRVCLVIGDKEDRHCGVKDYSYRLAEALEKQGFAVEVHASSDWSLSSFLRFRRKLRAKAFDIVHVQYPSIGFRYSLFPHILGLTGTARFACVTLHEYTRLPLVQKLSTHLFRLSTQSIVFTTHEERDCFAQLLRQRETSCQVIPIGSNVPSAAAIEGKELIVIYFGQLRPDKGLESFLDLAKLSSRRNTAFKFQVMGACLPRHSDYLRTLQHGAPRKVEWIIGEPLSAVAQHMSRALAAYLPFPDGATYRRGSLLGALVNGLPVISTASAATPAALARVILRADTAEDAFAHLETLREGPRFAEEVANSSRLLGAQFSWEAIAEAHRTFYESLHITSERVVTAKKQNSLAEPN